MMLSMAMVVNVSADDDVLLELNMDTPLVAGDDYIILDLDGKPMSFENGSSGKYLKYAGIIKFPLKQAVTSNQIEVSFDAYSPANGQGGNFWLEINDTNTDIKGFNEAENQLASWANWLFEINFESSKMNIYKDGEPYASEVATVSSIIGKTPDSVIIYSYPEFCIDNLVVRQMAQAAGVCYIEDMCFEAVDGSTAISINDLTKDVNVVNIIFSNTMDGSTVFPQLVSGSDPVSFTPHWNGKILSIVLDDEAVFETDKPYRLTIPAGYTDRNGSVGEEEYILNFERVNMSGVIGYYDMESEKNTISGLYNTRSYEFDESMNKFLNFRNDVCTFKLDEAATEGTLTVEFDYKNIDVDGNVPCYIDFDEDGQANTSDRFLFKIDGSDGGGDWIKFKLIADLEDDVLEVYKNGTLTETVTGMLGYFNAINGVHFERWNKNAGVDNLKVYYGNAGIKDYKFRDFGLNESESTDNLTSALDCIVVNFENEPDADSVGITLLNQKTGENEEVVLTSNGRSLEIRTQKGYFDASADYTLTLEKGYTNKYGYEGEDELELTFNTGENAFGIMSVRIIKNDDEVELSDINAGDTLEVEIVYVSAVSGRSQNAIVALTAEENAFLTSFSSAAQSLDQTGINTVKCPLTIMSGADFDAVYAYVWEAGTRIPLSNHVSVR